MECTKHNVRQTITETSFLPDLKSGVATMSIPVVKLNQSYFDGPLVSKIKSWYDETGSVAEVRRAIARDWVHARPDSEFDEFEDDRLPSMKVLNYVVQFIQSIVGDVPVTLSLDELKKNLRCLRWDWTYHQAKGIGVQEGDDWVGLAYTLGTLQGALGAILDFAFAPTEAIKHMVQCMERVFSKAVSQGLPAPEDVYIDDFVKYNRLILQVVTKYWKDASTRVGQDTWHAIMLLTTCLDRYHPDYRACRKKIQSWLESATRPDTPTYSPEELLEGVQEIYDYFQVHKILRQKTVTTKHLLLPACLSCCLSVCLIG